MTKTDRNLRKAAILFASLDSERAESVMRQMSPSQADTLSRAIGRLGELDPLEQNDVIEEFFRIGPLVPDKQAPGIELDALLPAHLALPQTELADRPEHGPQTTRPFRFLHEAPARVLAPFLEREQPQTVAVVLSRLPSERAAELLSGLPVDLQLEVARRLVDLDEADPEILCEVERGLESWLCEQGQTDRRRTAGLSVLNNILFAASPEAKQHILANLSRHDRQLAGKLRQTLAQPSLTFADLELLDPASLTVVLHHVQPELLVLALAGSTPEFSQRVFDLFPPVEAEALRSAVADLGPTRLSDVEQAQQELADTASQLELRGEIAPDARARLSVAV